jgi:thiol:disulfide interchange protein DsbC
MSFRRKWLTIILSAVLSLGIAAVSFAATDTAKAEASLRAAFPQVKFDTVTPSDIPGLYEVTTGPNVFYYYPDKDLVFIGDIVGKDLKSRTAERRAALQEKSAAAAEKAAQELPLDKAVKIGDGKNIVIEFTDPDCPYCRRAAEYWTKRTDVTRYVFFAPLAHPQAITKVEYILGAPNKAEAYDAMMLGQELPASAKPATDAVKALAQEHLALARKIGIQGTPTFFINGHEVVGADSRKFDELLNKK